MSEMRHALRAKRASFLAISSVAKPQAQIELRILCEACLEIMRVAAWLR
jgi:hypothetical protein